jgi:hypothetical protein
MSPLSSGMRMSVNFVASCGSRASNVSTTNHPGRVRARDNQSNGKSICELPVATPPRHQAHAIAAAMHVISIITAAFRRYLSLLMTTTGSQSARRIYVFTEHRHASRRHPVRLFKERNSNGAMRRMAGSSTPASNVAINRFALPNNTAFVGLNRLPPLFILQVSQPQLVTSIQNDRMFQHSEFSFRLADQVLLTYLVTNNPHPLLGVKALIESISRRLLSGKPPNRALTSI